MLSRKTMTKKSYDERIPVDGDASWAVFSAPLVHHLQKVGRQTWKALDLWAVANRMSKYKLKNVIAWLENRKMIDFDGECWYVISQKRE